MQSKEKGEMQLLGVSRKAHKLRQIINSFPKVAHLHAQSAFGNDLLKGTLDLQDSLIALGELQSLNELSQTKSMDRMRADVEPINGGLGESSQRNSIKNTDALLSMNCRNSISKRSCIEELKEVIKDNLCRQSIFYDCEDSIGRSLSFSTIRRHNSFPGMEQRKGSSASIGQAMTTRSPNLIAKLMGLQDIPAETIQSIKVDNESKRNLDPPRLPKIARSSERILTILKQKPKLKWETAQDVIERGRINACRVISDTSETSLSGSRGKRSKVTEGRWIMNSNVVNCTKRGKFQELQLLSDEILKQEAIRSAESAPSTMLPAEVEGILVRSTEETTLVDLSARNKEEHIMVNLKAMPRFGEESQEDCIDHTFLKQELEQSVELTPECISDSHANELPRERNRIVARRLENNKVELSSTIFRKSCNQCHKSNKKKEAVGSCKQQKSGLREKILAKPNEHTVKPVQSSLMKTDKKMAAIPNERKATSGGTVSRQLEGQVKQSATTRTNSTSRDFLIPLPEKDIMIEPTKRSNAMKLIKQKEKKTISGSGKTDASIRNMSLSTRHPKQRKHPLESSVQGKLRKGKKMINEVMPKASKIESANKLRRRAVRLCHNKGSTADIHGIDFKGLLLNSGLFLVHAFELCIHSRRDVHDETKELNEDGGNTELYLACAEELMARQSYHLGLSKHPMISCSLSKLSVRSSTDQLVEVINDGLITLTNYIKVSDDAISNHNLYIRLEKDLNCKDFMLNAMWDVGWWNSGICLEETDLLVGQVEEDILFYLVLEVAMELLQSH